MAIERPRPQLLVLFVLLLLAAAAYWSLPRWTTGSEGAASNVRGGAATRVGERGAAPDVRLEALTEQRSKPENVERNLFRFKAKAPVPPPPSPVKPPAPPSPGAGGPPPVPPIALKFIGIWELTAQKKKFALLSDGKGGVPIYGAEGDVVEGRYRILKIGAESIEMAYLDGRARQTIRLTGQ